MENDGKFKENKNYENDFIKNKNSNTNKKGKPFITKEHPLYDQYKQFMYLDDS